MTSETAPRHISQDMLQKLSVKYFVEDGLAGVIELYGHLGALI
jgi:hypothetical protein